MVRNAAHQPPPPPTDIVIRRKLPPARGGMGGYGGDEEQYAEIAVLEKKLKEARIPPNAQQTVERELSRLKRMQSAQPEYSIQRTYLETLVEIPWVVETEDRLDVEAMKRAREVLDRDHFGLEKVKRRVLEYLAVLRLKVVLAQEQAAAAVEDKAEVAKEAPSNDPVTVIDPTDPTVSIVNPIPSPRPTTAPELQQLPTQSKATITRAPILLLVGPPGTGKTSLAKSIATALGRKFHRISLGGIHTEAEIRGHRRTYIAAMPGVVVNGLRRVGVANPVLLLVIVWPDRMYEIDKIGGRSHNGDPSAALLEVLDPEQNWSFSDHYVNIPVDLSKVIFIATANDKREIPPALLDRMETIHLHAYTNLEKFHIASRFLIPKQVALNGLKTDQVQLPEQVIQTLINFYTREPGVRNLEREIGSVVRAKAVQYIDAKDSSNLGHYKPQVGLEELETILGMQRYRPDLTERGNRPGIVNGLVAFSSGHGVMSGSGAIIFIEAAAMPGQGNLTLTGNLGNVIKESAEVALTWVKAHAYDLGLTNSRDDDLTKNKSIHVHCPAGSDPKDGPSAGVAFIVALVSLFSDRPVPATLAMTGEVSLRGRVTAVGAIKEKLIGALSAGVKTVIVPAPNHYNVQELPDEVKRSLDIVCAQHIWDVLKVVWPDWSSVAAHDTLPSIAPINSRL
ncbi:Lon protease C-terminal proteolytic domain-containing protein [Terfezia claveryi]|nr:Lon protease C-terminal proteolytic domain-containing protein [Terfezia claveryi]